MWLVPAAHDTCGWESFVGDRFSLYLNTAYYHWVVGADPLGAAMESIKTDFVVVRRMRGAKDNFTKLCSIHARSEINKHSTAYWDWWWVGFVVAHG